jgi:hypothetical protein
MPYLLRNLSHAAAALTVLLTFACVGCKARELGANYAETQSAVVDNTWVTAVDACWPAVAHQRYSIEAVKHYLADPLHFRAAFAVYAPFTDDQLRAIVASPVSNAPYPDTSVLMHSEMPILTRVQAMAGYTDSATRAPSPDSLCSIQPGLPVGFR